jgi:hypothetical protein
MKFVRMTAMALVSVVLLAGFAHVTNSVLVKPIRLHFALAAGCKTFNKVWPLNSNSSEDSRSKLRSAFWSASKIDMSYSHLEEAAIFISINQGKAELNDSASTALIRDSLSLVVLCKTV